MNWYTEHTLTVSNLEVANYMIDHSCEMIGIEAIPEKIIHTKMIFRSKNVNEAYNEALSLELPPLTANEENRIISMISLLRCVKRQELAEAGGEV
jgi:hypothetical protein